MDSSNSSHVIAIAFGGAFLRRCDLNVYQMIELWLALIQRVRAILKYLPGFEPLETYLTAWIGGGGHRMLKEGYEPDFPEGMSLRTKVQMVAFIREARTTGTLVRETLLLTDDGQLIQLSAAYDLQQVGGGNNEVATQLTFEALGQQELMNRVSQNHVHRWPETVDHYLYKAIEALRQRAQQGVEEREERLKSVRDALDFLAGTLGRIEQR